MRRQVALVEHPARGLHSCGDIVCDFALVERPLAALSHDAQRAREIGIAEALPGPGCAAIEGERQAAEGVTQRVLDAELPEVSCEGRDREAFLGKQDRRRKDAGHRQPAVALDQIAPPGAGARDRDRVRVRGGRRGAEALLDQESNGRRGGRTARAVERRDPPGRGLEVERKTVAADAG